MFQLFLLSLLYHARPFASFLPAEYCKQTRRHFEFNIQISFLFLAGGGGTAAEMWGDILR